MPGWPCVPTPARHSPPCGGSTSCRRRPLPCCPSPRCLASAHAVAGEHGARRRPNVVAPVPGVGTRCGRRTRCPASTQRCYRCGSTSPRRPVQCCPAPRWSVLADTAAGNRRRHAARIAVGRRHHSSPCSVAQQHAGRFWQTQRLAVVAGMPPASLWVAVTTAPRSVLPNTTLVGSGRHCGLPSPPSCYWQTLRLALAAVRLLADTAACPRRRQATGRHCGLPSPPSGYWQTLRLALAAVMPSATVSTAPHAVCRPVPPCTTLPWAAPRRVASCCSASYGRHRAAPRRTIIQTPP